MERAHPATVSVVPPRLSELAKMLATVVRFTAKTSPYIADSRIPFYDCRDQIASAMQLGF